MQFARSSRLILFTGAAIAAGSAAWGIPLRNGTLAPATPDAPAAPAPTPKPPENPGPGFADSLHQMLHGGEELRQHDPLRALTGDMDQIVDHLDHQQTDAPVQTEQHQVVSRLDALIAELQKQCSGSGGAGNNPTKPMSDSKIAKGPGGSGPMHDPQAGTKNWGQLPPKEREQILQSQNEGFPAGYESILSSYYNRLAQEQVADEAKDKPTTRP